MIIRANDEDGDWLWGQSQGDILAGPAAIAQNVQTRLLCFKNDTFWDMSFGVDWFNLLGSFNPQAETGILLQTREMIATAYGIVAINSVDAAIVTASRSIRVEYDLSSIFSTNLTGTVQPLTS